MPIGLVLRSRGSLYALFFRGPQVAICVAVQCPLLGVKRIWRELVSMSANDPKRTFGRIGFNPKATSPLASPKRRMPHLSCETKIPPETIRLLDKLLLLQQLREQDRVEILDEISGAS